MTQKIPHILHQSWKTSQVPESLKKYQQAWQQMHPDWTFYLWTDLDNREFVKKYYSWFLPIYDGYSEAIMRADAVRYLILDHFGGVYADLDYECLRPMDPLLEDRELVFGLEPDQHLEFEDAQKRELTRLICNAWMASVPGHPFWNHLLKKLVEYHDFPGPLDATGPFLLTRACDTYENPAQITLEPASVLYPITNEKPWLELPLETQEEVKREAYGIHHWSGGWVVRNPYEKTVKTLASQMDHGQEVARYYLMVAQAMALQNKREALPKLTCMMVTRDRPLLAGRSVDCFRRQSYPNRELLVLDDGADPSLEQSIHSLGDPSIRFIRLPEEGKTLGELRNLAVELASGEYVAQWDDDDLSDPNRLEIQMAAIHVTRSDACLLKRQMIWFPSMRKLAVSNERFWESSFICRKGSLPPYPALRKGEDTDVIEKIVASSRVITIDYPGLYMYVFHHANTFEEAHWQNCWQAASRVYEGQAYLAELANLSALMQTDLSIYHQDHFEAKTRQPEIKKPEPPLQPEQASPAADEPQTILILVPVKDAEVYLPRFRENLFSLTYPHKSISIAFLESDSRDATTEKLEKVLPELRTEFARAELYQKDYGYLMEGSRWDASRQFMRRSILAKSRNYLLSRALREEDWVLWLDVDVARYPVDIIQSLLAVKKEIVVPNCVALGTDAPYDLNSFKFKPDANDIDWRPYLIDGILLPPAGLGRWYLSDLAMFDLVELDGIGAAMLLVKADLHREGLIFPPYSYHCFIETEGLSVMAREMGYRSYGLPKVVIHHPG